MGVSRGDLQRRDEKCDKCISHTRGRGDDESGSPPERRIQMPTDPRMIYMDRIPPYGSDAFMFNEQRAHVPRMRPYREATQAREYYVPQPLPVSPDYPGNDVDDRINREVLVKAGIFQGVEPSAVAALTRQLQPVTFPRGHTVFAEGEPGDRLYIIVSGKVKIGRRSPDGRENLLTIMGPSDMFGELSIFDPGPRTSSGTTITEVRAVSMDRDALRSWITGPTRDRRAAAAGTGPPPSSHQQQPGRPHLHRRAGSRRQATARAGAALRPSGGRRDAGDA